MRGSMRALAKLTRVRRRTLAGTSSSHRFQSNTSGSKSFQGVWPIVATPFHDDESVDLEGFAKSIRFFGECGASGATVCGVLGESNRLTDAERAQLVETAVGAAGAMPVCVGVSHAGTRATVDLAQMAQDLGAHSVMVTPTKEAFPQSDAQLFDYFAAVQDGCALPIVLQDHPASTGVFMGAELLVQICAHLASVQCIKLEAVPTPPKIAALRKAWAAQPPAFPECSILTGLGALYGGFDVEQGTDGFMTGFAFPEVLMAIDCVAIYTPSSRCCYGEEVDGMRNLISTQAIDGAARAGNVERAHAIYAQFLPLLVFEQQPGVGIRKEVYRLRGLIECGRVRRPAPQVSTVAAAALAAQIERSLYDPFPGVDLTKPLTPLFERLSRS